mmetsp:Transcript_14558/g.36755  ORF Transcript_14558/g.36755 Transcript_14558/m.36755 type:complete len:237 (+) Transcript_14558:146-856(+)
MAPEQNNDSASNGTAAVAETETNGTNGTATTEPKASYLKKMKMNKEVEALVLWEDPIKSGAILGGATLAYTLFHCSGYSALYIVCNLLLVGVVGTFVWSIIAQLLGKPEFPIPEPQPEAIEKAFAAVADKGKTVTNQGIGFFYKIAKGHEPALSLKTAGALYVMAKVSSVFSLLTLAYMAVLGFFVVPKVYMMYKEDIDTYVGIAKTQVDLKIGQAKTFVNDNVISKIKPPAKKTE